MDPIRHKLLQAELERLESEHEARSVALMNRAADLETAHRLCVLLNTGDHIDPPLQPAVVFEPVTQTCRIKIIAGECGAAALRHADSLGVGSTIEGGASEGLDVRLAGYESIEFAVTYPQWRQYLESVCQESAA